MTGYQYTASAPVSRASKARSSRPLGLARPLSVAALCVVALALLWVVAALVPATHFRDAVLLDHFTALESTSLNGPAGVLPHLLDPLLFTIWAIALVLVALARERPRLAAAVAVVTAVAPLSSETLKPLLAHPHVTLETHIGAASFPSGHSTAAAILALCAVLVAPASLRTAVAAVGAAFALAIGAALLIHHWHMPSDVLGGYLMAGMWAALAVAAVRASELRWPAKRRST